MSGHTPGPWEYRPQPMDDWGVVRSGRYWICQAKDPNVYTDEQLAEHRAARTDPWEANARLIAAAPDLLLQLTELLADIGPVNSDGWHDSTIHSQWVEQARAAVAKATPPHPHQQEPTMGLLEERDSMRFRLMQEGIEVAGTQGHPEYAMREIAHYHAVYSQDGPCAIEWYTKGRRWKATDVDEIDSALEFRARHALAQSKGSEG